MEILNDLVTRYPSLRCCEEDVQQAAKMMIACFEQGNKLLVCGNGGSAADSEHIVGELMKGFLKLRPLSKQKKAEMSANCPNISENLLSKLQSGLPAISMTGSPALSTAFANDVDPDFVFAQQVMALGKPGDVLLGISTSGNAKNVCAAMQTAKGIGMKTIALTGKTGGKMKEFSDIAIMAPEEKTFAVQELHLPIYHALCAITEDYFFNE